LVRSGLKSLLIREVGKCVADGIETYIRCIQCKEIVIKARKRNEDCSESNLKAIITPGIVPTLTCVTICGQSRDIVQISGHRIAPCLIWQLLHVTHWHSLTTISSLPMSKNKGKNLTFAEVLRDLALIRASDLDLTSLLPPSEISNQSNSQSQHPEVDEIESSFTQSQEFITAARAALRTMNRGDADVQGDKIEKLRSQLEAVQAGLDA
jgi:hypothetical protein